MRKSTTSEFIAKAIAIHGNKYDYSEAQYLNKNTKISIFCTDHGKFYQTPNNHLSGKGCPDCGIERMKDTVEGFVKKPY